MHNKQYSLPTHYIDLPNNVKVAYLDQGTGPQTLLFVHGLANYAMVWKKNIASLEKHYRCIAIDLPGNGHSDRQQHHFTMHFFADVIANFIAEMGLTNVCLVGHSMGGQIAMTSLLRHPNIAQKLVLLAPAGFEVFTAMDKTLYYSTIHLMDFLSSEENSLRTTIESSFYNQHKQGEEVISELIELMRGYKMGYYRRMIESCIKAMLEEPVLPKLANIELPTLIVFGKNDALIPNKLLHHTTTESIAQQGASKLKNSTLTLLPHAGHFLQWEKPDEINELIKGFVGTGA
jgi:pimeloyl-ACP methyl ester carboxylesterase